MSDAHLLWLDTGSTLRPTTLAPRRSNSFSRAATAPSSVVQTGVKSLGCEKSTAQPSPIHSWNLIVPCVVSAVKSGATSLMRRDILPPGGLCLVFWSCTKSKTHSQIAAGGSGEREVYRP